MDCSHIAEHHPELCTELLYTGDEEGNATMSVEPYMPPTETVANKLIGAVKDTVSEIQTAGTLTSETVEKAHDDDDMDRRKMEDANDDMGTSLADKSSSAVEGDVELSNEIEEDTAERTIASSPVLEPAVSESNNMHVVTVGSRYCPVSCNAVDQCKAARDHFAPSISVSIENKVSASVASEDSAITLEKEAGTTATKESSFAGSESTNVNEMEAEKTSAAEVEDSEKETFPKTLCQDDVSFLYKDLAGYDCAYIRDNKPDKCTKQLDGLKLGVVSCPESCRMVDECMNTMQNEGGTVVSKDIVGTEGLLNNQDVGTVVNDTEDAVENTRTNKTDETADVIESESEERVDSASSINVCEDDATFLYKELEGYDCAYIRDNKPEKCLKELGGIKLGAVSCPVACGMVDECKEMHKGDESMDSDKVMSAAVFGENEVVDKEETRVSEIGNGENEQPSSGYVNVGDVSGDLGLNGNDSSNESLCKDDATFLYKEKEGYNCHYIGTYKIEKCLKEHNGVMVGISACPESCKMESKCLEAVGSIANSSGVTTVAEHNPCKDSEDFRYNDIETQNCAWVASQSGRCEQETSTGKIIGKFFCPSSCGMLEERCNDVDVESVTLSDGGEDGDSLQSPRAGDTITAEASEGTHDNTGNGGNVTNSMEEQDKLSEAELKEQWEELEEEIEEEFGGADSEVDLEQAIEEQLEDNLVHLDSNGNVAQTTVSGADTNDVFESSFSNEDLNAQHGNVTKEFGGRTENGAGGVDASGNESYENEVDDLGYNYDPGDEHTYADDDGQVVSNDWSTSKLNYAVGGYDGQNQLSDNQNVYNTPSSAANAGAENIGEPETWNDPTQGGIQSEHLFNNNSSAIPPNISETWDDEEGGSPVGIFLLFLVLLAICLYSKKNRQDSSSHGGYQRVEPLDRSMYVSKRR
eukprot:g7597.t1 g7597   contig24:1007206-1010059(+)